MDAAKASRIFHIAPKNEWRRSRQSGIYRPSSLASQGFLHCSFPHQVLAVANSVFRGKKNLILLELDPGKLTSELRNEDLRRSGSPYPHLYGPLNCDAVVATYDFEPKADGTFVLPRPLVVPPAPA